MRFSLFAIALLAFSSFALAHHSAIGTFDRNATMEIEGELVEASWRMPHSRLKIDLIDESSGDVVRWTIEAEGINILRARGVDRRFVEIGERVRVRGWPSIHGRPEILGRNLQLGDGSEVLLAVSSQPYYALEEGAQLLEPVYEESVTIEALRNADGIFRVWSTDYDDNPFGFFTGQYPLLPEAQEARSQWDPASLDPTACIPVGPARLMRSVAPMEFIRQGEDILLRFEWNDSVRVIEMGEDAHVTPEVSSLLGYSTGHWEEETLVVQSSGIDADSLDNRGTDHSSAIRLLERFTPSADGALGWTIPSQSRTRTRSMSSLQSTDTGFGARRSRLGVSHAARVNSNVCFWPEGDVD